MSFLYTANVPQPTQTIALTQPIIQSNFQYLPLFANKDHNFTGDSTNATDGYHKTIHCIPQSTPSVISGIMQLYARNVGGGVELFARGNGAASQLTGYLSASEGYQFLGGVCVQWGRKSLASSQLLGEITFPNATAFIGAPYLVMVSLISPEDGATTANAAVSVANVPATNEKFTYSYRLGTDGSYDGFYWMAIGRCI